MHRQVRRQGHARGRYGATLHTSRREQVSEETLTGSEQSRVESSMLGGWRASVT